MRGLTYVRARKPAMAIDDFTRALKAPVGMREEPASVVFGYRSLAYMELGQNDAAMADFGRSQTPLIGKTNDYTQLALLCYTAALVGLYDFAQLTCDESVSRETHNMIGYEARTLTELMRGDYAHAIAYGTQSLYLQDNQVFSLYWRGLAKRLSGDRAGGDTDIAAATAIEPNVAAVMARLGGPAAQLTPAKLARGR